MYLVINDAEIITKNGTLKFIKGQTVKLQEQTARLLIQKGKLELYKPEPRQFEATFLNAVDEINRNYQPGVLDFIRQKYPERWNRSIEVEDRINKFWNDAKDLQAFQKAVDEWKEIQIQLTKLFFRD